MNKELEQYINGIDFSLITEDSILSNIYIEIGNNGTHLATNPHTATNLERLVLISNSQQLIAFIKTLSPKIIFKKLGSRIMESILKRLFECMYLRGEYFRLEDAVDCIDCAASVKNQDALHVLREAIMLLSGKKVDGLSVERHQLVESDKVENVVCVDEVEVEKSAAVDKNTENREYAVKKLQQYKEVFMKAISSIALNDAYITLTIFLQCVKSQSLLTKFLEKNCFPENIMQRGHVYEALPTIASKGNLTLIYDRIKNKVMALCLNDRSSYFMASFIRYYRYPHRILRRILLEKFECNSNVILFLMEALQREKRYEEVDILMDSFYQVKNDAFEKMILGKGEGLDTKYVDVIVQFMAMPSAHSYNVNSDFAKFFSPNWISSKAGRKLLVGFVVGGGSSKIKNEFLNKNVDLFWNCSRWKHDGRLFIKKVTEYTDGHARKKAFEILGTFSS